MRCKILHILAIVSLLCMGSLAQGQDAYEPNNAWDQATTITVGIPQQNHSIVPATDADWVKFTLHDDSPVVLVTSGPSGDTRMWLYDNALIQIMYDDDGGNALFSRIEVYLSSGTYYAKVDEDGNNNEIANYTISFAASNVNLLPNGDMESWTIDGPSGPPDYWDDVYLPAGASLSREANFKHGGQYSCKATWVTLDSPFVYSIPVSVIPLESYTIEGYARDADPAGYVEFALQYYDQAGGLLTEKKIGSGGFDSTLWRHLSVEDVAPVTANQAFMLISFKPEAWDGDATIHIDDLCLYLTPGVTPTPTPTPTPTATPSPSPTPTPTPTATPTAIPTPSPTPGPTGTPTPTPTPSPTVSPTPIPTGTPSPTPTPTPTLTPSPTPTPTPTATASPSPTPTPTPSPTPEEISRARTIYGLGTLQCLDYSVDGKYIITGGDAGAYIWHVDTGQVVRLLLGHTASVMGVAFLPDGSKIITGSQDKTAKLWDTATGVQLLTFDEHANSISSVTFSSDNRFILLGSMDSTASIWYVATGAKVKTFSGHNRGVTSVAFSPDGARIVTGSLDRTAKIWSADTGALEHTLTSHRQAVTSVAFSFDGSEVLTGSSDNTARLWVTSTGAYIRSFVGHFESVRSVAFSPQDPLAVLTGSDDWTAILWNKNTGVATKTFDGHTAGIHTVHFSADGSQILTGSLDGTAKLWDVSTTTAIKTFIGHTQVTGAIAVSPDGSRILTGSDNEVKMWDPETGIETSSFTADTSLIKSVDFSSDGTRILTGSSTGNPDFQGNAKLWEVGTQTEDWKTSSPSGAVLSVDFSPGGSKALVGYWDGTARLLDASTGEEIQLFIGHTDSVNSVAFSPYGTKVLTGSEDGTAKLWNPNTGMEIPPPFSSHTLGINSVAFSPDEALVVTGSKDATAKLWNANTGAEIRTFSGHTGSVNSVAFSPNGGMILTGSSDQTARVWDVITGAEVRISSRHTAGVSSVAFSTDGTKVLTGSFGGTTLLLELNPPRAVIVAGGGDFPGNPIADQTNELGDYAYLVLRKRGYEPGDIQYLSAFGQRDVDEDGLDDVDGWATLESLQETLTGDFGTGAGRLLIMMMDHGYRTQSFMAFRMNEVQVLPSTTLDSWLDNLQALHQVDVTLVVDSCYSGQFVEDCRGAPAGRKRIVIASTGAQTEAVFMPWPDMTSFMHTFLGSAYMGNSIGEAWRAGELFFKEFKVAGQVPQIDDGSSSTTIADKEFFGATWAYGVQSTEDVNRFFPAFEDWTTNTLVIPGNPVTLWARMLPGQEGTTEVVAVVHPPAPEVISGDPVTNLPHVYLQRKSDNPDDPDYRVWEATVSDVFTNFGVYVVSFTARFEYERISNPVFTRITVGIVPDPTPIWAILVIGETEDAGLSSAFEGLGPYAYSVYLDRFQDNEGTPQPEWIEYFTPFPDSDPAGTPNTSDILLAIDTLPSGIGRLYVHLIGDSDTAGEVRLSVGDSLSASALDTALDNLQSRQDCVVVLVVDSPYSGAFLPICKASGAQRRVVLTGSRANDTALFLPAPTLTSFSQKFLATAYQGNHLRDGFRSGLDFFQTFLLGLIEPQLDDTGDGEYKPWEDGELAQTLYLGHRYAFAGDEAAGLPFILDVTTTQTATPGAQVTYSVELIDGVVPTQVFAQRVSPGAGTSGEPISSLPEIEEFTRYMPAGWTWSATFAAPSEHGTHTLTVYAAYPDSPQDKLSEPAFTALVVEGIPTPITQVKHYTFDTDDVEGWGFLGLSGTGFSGASSSYSNGRISISSANDTTSRVGFWQSPVDIAYVADNVYLARYLVSSNAATASQNPQFRMRWTHDQSLESATQVVNASGTYSHSLPTDPTTKEYTCYIAPAVSGNLGVAFDMLDFSDTQYGAHYVDEVTVERFPFPALGTAVKTYTDTADFANWGFASVGFGPVTSGGAGTGTLQITSTVANANNYGWWQSSGTANELTYVADKLYRATYTLRCATDAARNTMPQVRLRIQNEDGQMTQTMELNSQGTGPGAMPMTGGTDYDVYFETPTLPGSPTAGQDGFIVTIDMLDFNPAQGGTIYMESVTIDYLAIP